MNGYGTHDRAGSARENSVTNRGDGVQIAGSTVTGNVAGGGNTGVRQAYEVKDPGQPDPSVTTADLIAALRALRDELEHSRAAGKVELAETDAADVHRALDEAEAAAGEPSPQAGPLRRRISTIVDVLGSSAALATAVSTVISVFQKLPLN